MLTTKLKSFIRIVSRYKFQKNYKIQNTQFSFFSTLSKQTIIQPMADQGKRTKETTGESIPKTKNSNKIGGPFKLSPNPQYIEERIKIYDNIIQQQRKAFETVNKRPIQITLKDGKVLEGKSFETTPIELAKKISKKLAENIIVAKVTYSKKDPSPLDFGF